MSLDRTSHKNICELPVSTMNVFVKTKIDVELDHERIQETELFPIMRSQVECAVDQTLALTLYVSRIFGVAPVTLRKKYNSYIVSVSPLMCAYSYSLVIILHAAMIAGVVIDFCEDSARSVRVRSATASLAWLTELPVVIVLVTVAVYTGPHRMNCMIHCLTAIDKVNSKIPVQLPDKGIKRKIHIIGILYLIVGNSLYLFDFYTFVAEAVSDGKDLNVVCLYLSFYLEFMATFPLELLFMNVVMKIVLSQKGINNTLSDLVCRIDSQAEKRQTRVKVIEVNSPDDDEDFVHKSNSEKDTELIRHLILAYGAICDVVRQINDSNAAVLILLLLSFFQHLVVAPYYLISFWASPKYYQSSRAMLQIFMCTFHTINMMIVVEPAHRSTDEMEKTQALLGQLTRRVSDPSEPLSHQLDMFFRQILLNPVSFRPMGICNLKRPIIATVFGGVTTYIVIILQFRALDKQSW